MQWREVLMRVSTRGGDGVTSEEAQLAKKQLTADLAARLGGTADLPILLAAAKVRHRNMHRCLVQ